MLHVSPEPDGQSMVEERDTAGDQEGVQISMPIYEYQSRECRGPAECPKRFSFWQSMSDGPVTNCVICRAPLERIPSLFSAGVGLVARSAGMTDVPAGSQAPPPTVKNIFGGGLNIQGCGHGPIPGQDASSEKKSS